MIKPYPRIISFTILIIYFEKYMDGILNHQIEMMGLTDL